MYSPQIVLTNDGARIRKWGGGYLANQPVVEDMDFDVCQISKQSAIDVFTLDANALYANAYPTV